MLQLKLEAKSYTNKHLQSIWFPCLAVNIEKCQMQTIFKVNIMHIEKWNQENTFLLLLRVQKCLLFLGLTSNRSKLWKICFLKHFEFIQIQLREKNQNFLPRKLLLRSFQCLATLVRVCLTSEWNQHILFKYVYSWSFTGQIFYRNLVCKHSVCYSHSLDSEFDNRNLI